MTMVESIAAFERRTQTHYVGEAREVGRARVVEVGFGRKPGMYGVLAATSDGWTDTSVLWIPDATITDG